MTTTGAALIEASKPEAMNWSTDNCTVARSVELFGDRWSFLVMRELFNGVRRFDDMRERTGMPRQVLSGRLAGMVEAGLIKKAPYQEPGKRTRTEYRFTEKGLALYPVLAALLDWGNRYMADEEGSPLELEHRECGGQVHAALVCENGHQIENMRTVAPRLGPGAKPREIPN